VAVILNKNKGHLYLTINVSSLKWYITCEMMVTRGYFFIDVLKMLIFKTHPVALSSMSSLSSESDVVSLL
jgi:hypothetical protein